MIYNEKPIEMKNSAYWFKCPVSIIFFSYYLSRKSNWNWKMTKISISTENPIEMKKWHKWKKKVGFSIINLMFFWKYALFFEQKFSFGGGGNLPNIGGGEGNFPHRS